MASDKETLFHNGYERGRTFCLTKGREAALQWIKDHPLDPDAYCEGIRAAIWDYEDANGLGHHDPNTSIA